MLTNSGSLNGAITTTRRPVSTAAGTQKVVIVNGSPEILELLENVLEAGRYDIVFVESSAHAYSRRAPANCTATPRLSLAVRAENVACELSLP